MSIHARVSGRVAVYTSNSSQLQHVRAILQNCCEDTILYESLSALEKLLNAPAPAVLVLVVSEESPAIANSEPTEPTFSAEPTLSAEPTGPARQAEFVGLVDFLRRFRQGYPDSRIVVATPEKLSLDNLCRIISVGIESVVNYQQSDFPEMLQEHVCRAWDNYVCKLKQEKSIRRYFDSDGMDGFVSASVVLQKVVNRAIRAARISDASVIVQGESGTGKQRIAELIHKQDPKRNKYNFVCVNCAAITGTLAESELFGHRKGAFTGATENRLGYFRSADKGTILMDEIGELPLSLQPKILRVLQEGLVMPVGSDKEYHVDTRIIVATNRDLEQMIKAGQFRLDLYQRLNVIQITVPPLRERTDDVPVLFEVFLRKYAHYYPEVIERVNPAVYEVLAGAIGQGNVRELENIVRRILTFKESGNTIDLVDLPDEIIAQTIPQGGIELDSQVSQNTINQLLNGSARLGQVVDGYERTILSLLLNSNRNQSALADRLGITRRTLYNKLQKYNLR
ncbi:MAG: sigma-54-dependent Fis family transcriptional regulator [Sedimentisphaerales bacterium]|nr:sigma-54-dependent Fis family transcriptional regulator [Sedimentisphaerales bacterium]